MTTIKVVSAEQTITIDGSCIKLDLNVYDLEPNIIYPRTRFLLTWKLSKYTRNNKLQLTDILIDIGSTVSGFISDIRCTPSRPLPFPKQTIEWDRVNHANLLKDHVDYRVYYMPRIELPLDTTKIEFTSYNILMEDTDLHQWLLAFGL